MTSENPPVWPQRGLRGLHPNALKQQWINKYISIIYNSDNQKANINEYIRDLCRTLQSSARSARHWHRLHRPHCHNYHLKSKQTNSVHWIWWQFLPPTSIWTSPFGKFYSGPVGACRATQSEGGIPTAWVAKNRTLTEWFSTNQPFISCRS